MTMMQKMQAKKSKKGFTLVELVIVIAILAILAAIAIPVITTTINSAKISTLESDCATVNMLIKDAVNTSKASISTTTYNGDGNTADKAKIEDVLLQNDIGKDDAGTAIADDFFERKIGNATYYMIWNPTTKNIEVSSESTNKLAGGTEINTLDPEGKN